MIKDITFAFMRKKTKYSSIELLPASAMTVNQFAKKFKFSSPSYVHMKYMRYFFGYKTNKGVKSHTQYPGFDIVDFKGNCYVIVKDEGAIKKIMRSKQD